MGKEIVLEIEFKQVWDKWAWRIKKIELEAGEETNEIGEVFSTTIEKIDGVWRIGGNGNPTFYENMLITSEARHVLELIEKGINEKYGKPKRWRAGYAKGYFYIKSFGEIYEEIETHDTKDEKLYKCGNYFQTREQAEKALERVKEIFKRYGNE